MDIKLLSNVLHDGELLPAGLVCHEVPEAEAMRLIVSGAAVDVGEILDTPPAPPVTFPGQEIPGNAAPRELPPIVQPEASGAARPAAPDEDKGEPGPDTDAKPAEGEPKPAKKEGK